MAQQPPGEQVWTADWTSESDGGQCEDRVKRYRGDLQTMTPGIGRHGRRGQRESPDELTRRLNSVKFCKREKPHF